MKTKVSLNEVEKMDSTSLRILLDENKVDFPRGLREPELRELVKETFTFPEEQPGRSKK